MPFSVRIIRNGLLVLAAFLVTTKALPCSDYGCGEYDATTTKSTSKKQASLGENIEIHDLIAADCGQTVDSKDYTFEIGKHYIWRITAEKPSQRVVMGLEYYGETWIYRSMLGTTGNNASWQIGKQINKASPRKPTGSASSTASESRSLLAFNCTKQVFAVFSGGDMTADYMSKEKLLVSACDRQRIMPGYLVMSKDTDTSLLVDFALLAAASSSDDIPRFTITIWPVDLPPGVTMPTISPTTTAASTTTTTTTTTTTKPTTTSTKTSTTSTTTKPTTTTRTTTTTTRPVANCGRVVTPATRVMGGQVSTITQYPWLVQLRYRANSRATTPFNYQCVGTLIHPSWVVTALHCFFPGKATLSNWIVVAGANSSNTPVVATGVRQEKIAQLKWNDDILGDTQELNRAYNPITEGSDIVLLKLIKPINNFTPICLPSNTWSLDENANCKIAAWGATSKTSTALSIQLNAADINLISRRTCNQPNWYNGRVKEDFFCAGNKGVDTCKGDGGASLICVNAAKNYDMVGIAAWGRSPCGQPTTPGVYVQVANYVDWINNIVNPPPKKTATVRRPQYSGGW